MKQSVGVVSKKLFKYVRSVAGGGAAFVVVDKGFVYKAVAAGSGVVAGEVPVSGVVRYRLVHRLHRLEYYLDFGASAFRSEEFGDFRRHLFIGERGVYLSDIIHHFLFREVVLLLATIVAS